MAFTSTGPHSRCAQRCSRAPGARGSSTTSGPPFSSLRSRSSSRKASTEEMSAKRRQRSELIDRKSTRLNSSHLVISYAVFCLKKKKDKYLYEVATQLLGGLVLVA